MITKQLIDQIEGEASIYFDMQDDLVSFATIAFPHFRGMEAMLQGKNALDALVITPRVCGICGHAHLMACVHAIEDAYKNAGYEVQLSQKAKRLREFTLVMEIVQNHFKWFYLTIIPELSKLAQNDRKQTPLKGAFAASLAAKAIALFAGQWPHSSYILPGGVTCDPTNIEILQADSYLDELIAFFENESLGTTIDIFLSFESCKDFNALASDVSFVEEQLIELQMHKKGTVYDRFLVAGSHTFTKPSKLLQTRSFGMDVKHINTQEAYTPQQMSYAKNALYKGLFYETGPLARTIATSQPLIKNMHRRFKDSAYSRVMARIIELGTLLKHAKELLGTLNIQEASFNQPVDISKISAYGIGAVEAPRGPLLHEVCIENGLIKEYKITTPTQFNIGSSVKSKPTPAQKAMIGVSQKEALFIFRTFDVCSVCTTH